MDTIDKIYIINLDEREDRFKQLEKELKSLDIKNYVRFPAVKPNVGDYPWEISNQKFASKDPYYIRGSLGCKLSHLSVLRHAKINNYKKILVLEDDIEFTRPLSFVDIAVKSLKGKDYMLLYLSTNLYRAKLKLCGQNLANITNALCAHSYIVNCKYLDQLIQGLTDSKHEVDVFYKEIQQTGKCYTITPGITKQKAGYSNIMERNVIYESIG